MPDSIFLAEIGVARVSEADMDATVSRAGGWRYDAQHGRIGKNADYEFMSAFVELKLIETEGFDEPSRQPKLARLFEHTSLGRPVVVINPAFLDDRSRREYLNIMGQPIQHAVKKAGKQLEATRQHTGHDKVRVLVAINNGYGALWHDEFAEAVVKFATHDTSKIDVVVVGGIYNFADDFDNYVIAPFDEIPIRIGHRFEAFSHLRDAWNQHIETMMTEVVHGKLQNAPQRRPLRDLAFEYEGRTYVKPAPPTSKPSRFFPEGRPRLNSTGIEVCPPVGHTFPLMDENAWVQMQKLLPHARVLRDTFANWILERNRIFREPVQPDMPLVGVEVQCAAFKNWCESLGTNPSERLLLDEYIPTVFSQRVRELVNGSRPKSETRIIIPSYILVTAVEVGQDRAFDCVRIDLVEEGHQDRRITEIVAWRRMLFEHGQALGAAHAMRLGIDVLRHHRDQTYAWK